MTRTVWYAAALYTAVLTTFTWVRYEAFLTESDHAVFAQFTWLFGTLSTPFSSITLRPMLADHWEPAVALLAPLGAIGAGPVGILLLQALALALVAPLLLRLARQFGAIGWAAAIVPLLWLVSPVVVKANLWDFHPDAFVAALLVLAVVAAKAERHWLLVGAVALACGLKEDAGLTFAALGLVLVWNGQRRVGAILAVSTTTLAVFLNGILLPRLWPSTREHYTERFVGDRGDSLADLARYIVNNPLTMLEEVFSQANLGILALLVLTTGGLCLLAPRWLIVAVPSVGLNLLSVYEGQHRLTYQYWLVPVTAVAIAGAVGAHRVGLVPAVVRRSAVVAVGVGLAAGSVWTLGATFQDIRNVWPLRSDRLAIVAAIPPEASVSAPLHYLSKLAERHDLYTFPVPFVESVPESEWDPAQIAAARMRLEYVVFDPTLTRDPEVVEDIVRLGFAPVLRRGTTVLYRSLVVGR